jgi:AbrB family looped-hinge helix DNA binding protein
MDQGNVKMHTATLSSKYQLAIPKVIRDLLNLQAGQQFTVLAKGKNIELVPVRSLKEMRGILKGANTENYRDRQDRF